MNVVPEAYLPARPILQFGYETDAGISTRAGLGLIVLATDQSIEHEFRLLTRLPGVAFFESRIPSSLDTSMASLRALEGEIAKGPEVILPGVDLDVVAFGCTSASMVLGEKTIEKHVQSVRPGVKVTTPVTGAFAALRAMGAKNIAVLTPYVDDVNEHVRQYLEDKGGVVVTHMGSFKEPDDLIVPRITAKAIAAAAKSLVDLGGVDAVFLSCTSLRVAEAIREIEAEVGVPVTSSNHALAWHSLRLEGVQDSMPQYGKLFTLDIERA